MPKQLNRLAANALIYGFGEILNRFINFLLLPAFTHYLTPEEYGVSSVLTVLAFLVVPVFSLGFGAAMGVVYFDAKDAEPAEHRRATIGTAFGLLIVSAAILAVAAALFAAPISRLLLGSADYQRLVTFSLLTACLSILTTPLLLHLQFEERARLYVTLTVTSTIISISLSVLMVVILRRGVAGLIEAGLMEAGVTFGLFFAATWRVAIGRWRRPIAGELLRHGVPLIPAFFFLFIIYQANKYILQAISGLGPTGVYSVGFNLGYVMATAVIGFQNAWLPYFMRYADRRDEARVVFGRILTYYVLGMGAINLLFYIVAKPLVMVMTQPDFHDAYRVVGLSASAQFLTGIFSILLPGVYFAKQVKYISLVQGIAAAISVAMNVLLISVFGFAGAGVGLAMGVVAMDAAQYLWNRRQGYLKVDYEWRRIGLFAAIYLIYILATFWQRSLPLGSELILSGLELLPLPLILYALLSADEKRAARHLAGRLRRAPSSEAAS